MHYIEHFKTMSEFPLTEDYRFYVMYKNRLYMVNKKRTLQIDYNTDTVWGHTGDIQNNPWLKLLQISISHLPILISDF